MKSYLELKKNKKYKVKIKFIDYDKHIHQVGEEWIFIESIFLPYEDGVSLIVTKNNKTISYRFQLRYEQQENLLNNFMDYIDEVI